MFFGATPCILWWRCYNRGMLKAALITVLALVFLPAIKVALLCVLCLLEYLPSIF